MNMVSDYKIVSYDSAGPVDVDFCTLLCDAFTIAGRMFRQAAYMADSGETIRVTIQELSKNDKEIEIVSVSVKID